MTKRKLPPITKQMPEMAAERREQAGPTREDVVFLLTRVLRELAEHLQALNIGTSTPLAVARKAESDLHADVLLLRSMTKPRKAKAEPRDPVRDPGPRFYKGEKRP